MEKKAVGAIVTLAAATALFLGAVHLKSPAKRFEDKSLLKGEEQELSVQGYEGITKAVSVLDKDGSVMGHVVTVTEAGFGGDIVMEVAFDPEVTKVMGLNVVQQSETPEFGGRITEDAFRGQFDNVDAPVYLPGMPENKKEMSASAAADLVDGTYEKTMEAGDYTDVITMTVSGGKITELVWDSIDADGNKKSVLSENGQYVMTEDGLTWKEQAEALAQAVIENQSTAFLNPDEKGKTDAVAGVSISIGGFVNLLEDVLAEAGEASQPAAEESAEAVTEIQGTVVDGVSGATISSTAVVSGINRAFEFLKAEAEL